MFKEPHLRLRHLSVIVQMRILQSESEGEWNFTWEKGGWGCGGGLRGGFMYRWTVNWGNGAFWGGSSTQRSNQKLLNNLAARALTLCSQWTDGEGWPWTLHLKVNGCPTTAVIRASPTSAVGGTATQHQRLVSLSISLFAIFCDSTWENQAKMQFPISNHAHIKVKSSFYFLLKSSLSNDEIIKSVWGNAVPFSEKQILLFSYSSLLLKPHFPKSDQQAWFSHAQSLLVSKPRQAAAQSLW